MQLVQDAAAAMEVRSASLLRLSSGSVTLGDTKVLSDLNLDIRQGQVALLAGANGAGKSTLLRVLAEELPLTSGVLTPIPGLRTALLGDAPVLYDVLTPREHLEFFARFWQRKIDVTAVLGEFGLDHLRASYGRELSLGERQRLSVALLMVGEPQLVLMDEPFNGLDAATAGLLRRQIRSIADGGAAVLLVTHTVGDLGGVTDRLIVLDHGRISEDCLVSGSEDLREAVARQLEIRQ